MIDYYLEYSSGNFNSYFGWGEFVLGFLPGLKEGKKCFTFFKQVVSDEVTVETSSPIHFEYPPIKHVSLFIKHLKDAGPTNH